MSYLQQIENNGFGKTVKLAIGTALLTAGTIIGTYGYFGKSDNIERHLRSRDPYCLNVKYYPTVQFLKENKDVIARVVEKYKKYGISAEEIAAILIDHNPRRKYEDWKDYFGELLARTWNPYFAVFATLYKKLGDPTLGPGQVKLSTAMNLDKKFSGASKGRYQTLSLLKKPEFNIEYIAMALADLKSRKNRKSKTSDPLDDPRFLSAVITTEYRIGETLTPIEAAEPSKDNLRNSWLPLAGLNLTEIIGVPFRMTDTQRKNIFENIEKKDISTEDFRNEAWKSERQELVKCLN